MLMAIISLRPRDQLEQGQGDLKVRQPPTKCCSYGQVVVVVGVVVRLDVCDEVGVVVGDIVTGSLCRC